MARANTASLDTNFNVDPYYDDFDETKNFHRVLYRPGFAVQARELTQMQTILQNQIDRFGEHIFREGSVVSGLEVNYDDEYNFVKVRDGDNTGNTLVLSDGVGKYITGATSNVTAIVIDTIDGSEADSPNTKTLYVKYIDTGTQGTSGNTTFSSGERLIANSGSFTANVISSGVTTGSGSHIKIEEGIIFAKDHFIKIPSANLLLGRYSSNVSYKIGFNIAEEIVTSAGDTSLLDPSQGSFNYTAPGANRLKLTPSVAKYELTANTGDDFVEIYRVQEAHTALNNEKPRYSEIRDYFAQRTHDINGDFIVKGLGVRLREHLEQANNQGVYSLANGGDSTKLVVDIDPGKAYVGGYDIENLITAHVNTTKSTDFESIEASTVSANYGNYVVVKEVSGAWDVNTHDIVNLHKGFARSVSNTLYSTSAAAGDLLGTARVRALEYVSGTKGDSEARYNMYLYDVKTTANTFSEVRSIRIDNSAGSQANGIADVVVSSANTSSFNENTFNRVVFRLPAKAIKRLRDTTGNIDTNFQFLKSFDVTIAADGTFSVATGAADETYPFSAGALNATQKNAGFYVVLNANTASTSAVDTGSMANMANTVTGLTSAATKFNVGDRIQLADYANNFTVSSVSSTSLTTLEPALAAISSKGIVKKFNKGQVIDMSGVGGDNGSRTVTIASATSATFDIQETLTGTATATVITELTKVDGREIAKNFNSNRFVEVTVNQPDGTTNTTGPWNLGLSDIHEITEVRKQTGNTAFTAATQGTDVTANFLLDNGQKDNMYDHGKLKLKPGSSASAGDVYLVKLNYFTHDTSQGVGYFSVDSYPIDDVLVSNTTAITTQEIPLFVSPASGNLLDLRDCVDIRPRITDTAADATSVGAATTNPATSTTIVSPSGGLRFMAPNENLTADLDYYLGRNDKISLSPSGDIRVTKGKSSINPVTPEEPSGHLPLATVYVQPFPSLAPDTAKNFNRYDLSAYIEPIKSRRFTMQDIGNIKTRLDKVEYYTRLSLAEQEAKNLNFADGNGIDRFKNGMIVDTFTGHNIGDVGNPDYAAAIDKLKGELRPQFKLNSIQLDSQTANSSNLVLGPSDATLTVGGTDTFTVGETITAGAASGKLVYQVGRKLYLEQVSGTFSTSTTASGGSSSSSGTISAVSTPGNGLLATLPYTHLSVIDQPSATTTRNAAGLFWSFIGNISLSPDTDMWVDTTTAPDIQLNFESNLDNWPGLENSWQTEWNNWQTTGTGVSTSSFTSTSETRVRAATGLPAGGNRVADVDTIFRDTSTNQVRSVTTSQSRTGISTGIEIQSQTERTGPRVIDTNLIPFMRSRIVQVTGRGFKPNTRLYSFFDGTDVSAFVTPTTSAFANTAVEGGSLFSDSDGDVYAEFRIPASGNLRFKVGDRLFRLTDNVTNASGAGLTTTSGEALYSARGLSQTVQDTVISTRLPQLATRTVSESRSFTSSAVVSSQLTAREPVRNEITWRQVPRPRPRDPIAQTFIIDNSARGVSSSGAFLSKIDLFFGSKDSSRPVFIEIREVDPTSSFITNKIVPFSEVIIEAADINTSSDGSLPTPVNFKTPIHLKDQTEYAVVIKPGADNPDTTLFVSRLGGNDLITGERIVKQPYVGTMYASSNNKAWNAIQEEDLKFKLYIAQFTTSTTAAAVFKNKDIDFMKINNGANTFNTIGESIHGETTLTLSNGIAVNSNMVLVGNTSGANCVVTSNNSGTTSIRVKDVSLTKFTTGEHINVKINNVKQADLGTISGQSTATGKIAYYDRVNESGNTIIHVDNVSGTFTNGHQIKGQTNSLTATIDSIDVLEVDTLHLNSSYVSFDNTTVSPFIKLNTSKTARDSAFRRIEDNENEEFTTPRFVLSKSIENANISGEKSAEFKYEFNTTDPNLSPMFDIERVQAIVVNNKINNDSTGETSASGGNAEARYMTRILELADGQDAEDIKVKLNAYKPSGTDVKVYYKILHRDDSDFFDDRSWVAMGQDTTSTVISSSENNEDFKVYDFSIPSAELSGPLSQVQYTNSDGIIYTGFKYMSIKIVLTSSNQGLVPRVKDLMAIALQI